MIFLKSEKKYQNKKRLLKKTETNVGDDNKMRPVDVANQSKKGDDNKNQSFLPWPKIGGKASYMVTAFRFQIFVDAAFVKSANFHLFLNVWEEVTTNRKISRFFFVPTFEKNKLSALEMQALPNTICKEFFCANLADCFGQIKRKDPRWNIIWLTDDAKTAIEARQYAEDNDVQFRYYGVTADGTLVRVGQPQHHINNPEQKRTINQPLFEDRKEIHSISQVLNPPSVVPGTGGRVYVIGTQQQYILHSAVMTDHLSITYKTEDPAFFAKIYTAQALSFSLFKDKAERMTSTVVKVDGVCWPQATLADSMGHFIGVLVPAS